MLRVSALFCIGGRGETRFLYRPRNLRAKSLLVNTARSSVAQATESIRKESVVSACIINPTGGN